MRKWENENDKKGRAEWENEKRGKSEWENEHPFKLKQPSNNHVSFQICLSHEIMFNTIFWQYIVRIHKISSVSYLDVIVIWLWLSVQISAQS